jgi:hypothetical protein
VFKDSSDSVKEDDSRKTHVNQMQDKCNAKGRTAARTGPRSDPSGADEESTSCFCLARSILGTFFPEGFERLWVAMPLIDFNRHAGAGSSGSHLARARALIVDLAPEPGQSAAAVRKALARPRDSILRAGALEFLSVTTISTTEGLSKRTTNLASLPDPNGRANKACRQYRPLTNLAVTGRFLVPGTSLPA